MWTVESGQKSRCKRLTNRVPQLAQYFSGILRTAYLYSEQIILTFPEVFDGIFFLTFGPAAVREILGLTHQNKPTIIISGTEPTLLGCLQRFTVTTNDAQAIVQTKHLAHDDHDCARPATRTDNRYALAPKVYSALNLEISEHQRECEEESISTILRKVMEDPADNAQTAGQETQSDSFINAVVTSLEIASGMKQDGSNLSLLKRRWKEWIDAEIAGDVEYASNAALSGLHAHQQSEVKPTSFASVFKEVSAKYQQILVSTLDLKEDLSEQHTDRDAPDDVEAMNCDVSAGMNPSVNQHRIFLATLQAISSEPRRSRAFCTIETSGLAQGCAQPAHPISSNNTANDSVAPLICQQTLHDWYEFVYRKTMSQYLNSYLVSVNLDPSSIESMMVQTRSKESLTISGDITTILSTMPSSQFTRLWYSCATTVADWRQCDAHTSLTSRRIKTRNMSYAVKQMSQQKDFRQDAKAMFISVITSIVLATVSILTDNLIFTHISSVGIIILIACIIQIAPTVVNGIKWFYGTNSRSASIVYLE